MILYPPPSPIVAIRRIVPQAILPVTKKLSVIGPFYDVSALTVGAKRTDTVIEG